MGISVFQGDNVVTKVTNTLMLIMMEICIYKGLTIFHSMMIQCNNYVYYHEEGWHCQHKMVIIFIQSKHEGVI